MQPEKSAPDWKQGGTSSLDSIRWIKDFRGISGAPLAESKAVFDQYFPKAGVGFKPSLTPQQVWDDLQRLAKPTALPKVFPGQQSLWSTEANTASVVTNLRARRVVSKELGIAFQADVFHVVEFTRYEDDIVSLETRGTFRQEGDARAFFDTLRANEALEVLAGDD